MFESKIRAIARDLELVVDTDKIIVIIKPKSKMPTNKTISMTRYKRNDHVYHSSIRNDVTRRELVACLALEVRRIYQLSTGMLKYHTPEESYWKGELVNVVGLSRLEYPWTIDALEYQDRWVTLTRYRRVARSLTLDYIY